MITDGGDATRAWVERQLAGGERLAGAEPLRGGWTSEMRGLRVEGPAGRRGLVLRSFVKPFYVQHAEGLLSREAAILRLLAATDVPAATLVGVDATGSHCDHPSLLMSQLPGSVRLDDEGAERRADLLAAQLVRIHRVEVPTDARPRAWQAWTSPERVALPQAGWRPELWRRAVDVIRQDPPAHRSCFLHRDFHPGNVLFEDTFEGAGDDDVRVSGVVDWVETSWGPADLDVAHCSTALSLLHGVPLGMTFADRYLASGGRLDEDGPAHLYWRIVDALAFAPDAEKVAVPWRELGRTELTPDLLGDRLEQYLHALFERYA
ncbi:phosphotransferase family protein [Streptacidiphilus jiangxiensis]|uniref:Predicted kinase, aminoglycoside phosphotransferase (APT) family n=1 Tax=Streptacidiphilus jiangxiensis TaxID=235985 RepID=A0A1H7N6F1_STRJI|nr:aminoglycoside phosphotransferase family protein [Streptacidiphilus jiangxiensis]SEL19080.1 Predicted kinase, aminoglycoside phosphotransferase (APT) family [Streptacidiphilus jiangxiensis]